jgi:hypothetical protein
MSAFGKYGVGGSLPGKSAPGPDESAMDIAAAAAGTGQNLPDTKPIPELKH